MRALAVLLIVLSCLGLAACAENPAAMAYTPPNPLQGGGGAGGAGGGGGGGGAGGM